MAATPAFAFVVHPRDEGDIMRAPCLSLLRQFSADEADFLTRALSLPPTLLGEVTFGFSPFRGDILSIACLPADVMTARGRREIQRAVHVAAERGALVVGLGALTAPATAGGAGLLGRIPSGVTLTNGNAYTAAVLVENVVEASARFARMPRVAVVGCTGSVGGAVSRLLAERGFDLVLVGRTEAKARRLLADLVPVAEFSEDPTGGDAQIVLLLTNVSSERLGARRADETVVIIDAAEPSSVSEQDLRGWPRAVSYARGARVLVPGYRSGYDFGLPVPEETYACLAETYLFVREGVREHSVGSPDVVQAKRVARAALRHGVSAAPLIYRGGSGPSSRRRPLEAMRSERP